LLLVQKGWSWDGFFIVQFIGDHFECLLLGYRCSSGARPLDRRREHRERVVGVRHVVFCDGGWPSQLPSGSGGRAARSAARRIAFFGARSNIHTLGDYRAASALRAGGLKHLRCRAAVCGTRGSPTKRWDLGEHLAGGM
jgi:hypothetical protein